MSKTRRPSGQKGCSRKKFAGCLDARRVLNALLALLDQHHKAVIELDPSFVARGLYDLAQAFSSFYAAPEGRVVGAAPRVAAARAALVRAAQAALGANLRLLGITPLDEM